MQPVNMLVMRLMPDAELEKIVALDPRIHLLDGRGLFEMQEHGVPTLAWYHADFNGQET